MIRRTRTRTRTRPCHTAATVTARCAYLGSFFQPRGGIVHTGWDVYLSADPVHLCRDAAGNECAEVLLLIDGKGALRMPLADARGIVAEDGYLADVYRNALKLFDAR